MTTTATTITAARTTTTTTTTTATATATATAARAVEVVGVPLSKMGDQQESKASSIDRQRFEAVISSGIIPEVTMSLSALSKLTWKNGQLIAPRYAPFTHLLQRHVFARGDQCAYSAPLHRMNCCNRRDIKRLKWPPRHLDGIFLADIIESHEYFLKIVQHFAQGHGVFAASVHVKHGLHTFPFETNFILE